MDTKDSLLQTIRIGLANGTIQTSDLTALVAQTEQPVAGYGSIAATQAVKAPDLKLGIVDVLFYLAGLVLFAALMVMTNQVNGGAALKSALLIGAGLTFWIAAYAIGRTKRSENIAGITNATLLVGSLSLISGARTVLADLLIGVNIGYAATIALIILGAFHLLFDTLFRHMLLVVVGMLLLVAAFPTALSAILHNMDLPLDVWALIGVGTGLLLAFAGYITSRTAEGRQQLLDSFLSIAGFIVLGSTYALTLETSRGLLWTILFPFIVYGAFFLSIKRRSKIFLITGSLYLVVFVISVAFKYFSGFGAAFCLVLSALGLLATAFMANAINKRYIKKNDMSSVAKLPIQEGLAVDGTSSQAAPAAASPSESTEPASMPADTTIPEGTFDSSNNNVPDRQSPETTGPTIDERSDKN